MSAAKAPTTGRAVCGSSKLHPPHGPQATGCCGPEYVPWCNGVPRPASGRSVSALLTVIGRALLPLDSRRRWRAARTLNWLPRMCATDLVRWAMNGDGGDEGLHVWAMTNGGCLDSGAGDCCYCGKVRTAAADAEMRSGDHPAPRGVIREQATRARAGDAA